MQPYLEYLNISSVHFESIALAVAVWAWFFILTPWRAFHAGAIIKEAPFILKSPGFQLVRIIALPLLAGFAFFFPIRSGANSGAQALIEGALIETEDLFAAPLAVLVTLVVLILLPAFVGKAKMRNDQPVGGWVSPALTLWGYSWLGFVLLLAMGIVQYYLSFAADAAGAHLTTPAGIVLALIGIGFYAMWWGLPLRKTLEMVHRGDSRASADLQQIRWVGLPAYISYKMSSKDRLASAPISGERKFCPSCMRPIDMLTDYLSLDFDHCPHCKELIPAAFSLKDFVNFCAEQTLQARSQTGRGRAAKRVNRMEEEYVQHIMRGILAFGVRSRATDIHIGMDSTQVIIRYRIDGVLQTVFTFPSDINRAIISVVKVMSKLDISEQRKPQDGSFKTTVDEIKLDVRVNTSPAAEGETASLRLIYRHRCFGAIDQLGMTSRARGFLEQYIKHPHGLILVTGPTGSGKSTTLYNSLAAITDGKRNIITLEDPIEFKIDGLTQMQVDPRKGFSFASGLRSILRQDPDVIMVGEVRDAETAKMAVDASMTGHLVFTTLHTIDTTTAIGRLFDLGVDPTQYAEALLVIIAQRLVRLNCKHCAEEYAVTRDELAEMGMPGGPPKLMLKRGVGCDFCFKTGYYDREGIYELLPATGAIKRHITERSAPYVIRDFARSEGMRTLLEDGLIKAIRGRTTIEELQRVTA